VRVRHGGVPREDADSLRWGAAAGTRRTDRIGRFRLADLLGMVADEAAALDGYEHVHAAGRIMLDRIGKVLHTPRRRFQRGRFGGQPGRADMANSAAPGRPAGIA
jgi:hypothetical protein